jgi:tripartite-type tricarboxylate transporter receptor subunit TctC
VQQNFLEETMRIRTAVGVLFWLAIAAAQAQSFPVKPVRIIVPTEPGGSSDTLARFLGGKLQEHWGQPVIVENRAGANQMIGADVVVKAPADGHAVVLRDDVETAIRSDERPDRNHDDR